MTKADAAVRDHVEKPGEPREKDGEPGEKKESDLGDVAMPEAGQPETHDNNATKLEVEPAEDKDMEDKGIT